MRSLAFALLLMGAAAGAATLPAAEGVNAHVVACELDPRQVSWQPGLRDIIAIFVMSVSENERDADKARVGGACLGTWVAGLGFHPVVTVQIPEGH